MSSVFISNVDDYLAPSQACVNPMFTTEPEKKEPDKTPNEEAAAAVVVPRRRRRRTNNSQDAITPPIPIIPPSTPAQVTMADCLACSGCVTTAETVLIEQHSLQTLQQHVLDNTDTVVAMTISPASWADVARKLGQSSLSTSFKRKLTTFLQTSCRAKVVLDGTVPLQWSLQEAAREFCHAYSRRHLQETFIPLPTMALSSTEIQNSHGLVEKCASRPESRLPLLSSSCPALVCLVEKSTAAAVPHLSTTISPMGMAGTYLKSKIAGMYHVAVMPCHDKKLEASRKDLHSSKDVALVDLVITTSELWTLLCQSAKSEHPQDVLQFLHHLPMAPVSTRIQDVTNNVGGLLIVSHDEDVEPMDTSTDTDLSSSHPFFPYGSGGYADYVFKFASRQLFGYNAKGELPWTPVKQTNSNGRSRVVSARVAAVQTKRRDHHQICLYQHSDGTFSCDNKSPLDDVPVLRFATAYGLQNIQRVLQSAPFSTSSTASTTIRALAFDYVEAMACPFGCPNGGGQIREANQRETPTETRERVSKTIQVLKTTDCCNGDDDLDYPHDLCPTGPFGVEAKQVLHTRFHVVPPLLHTMGAAAGVDVKDTQW